MLKKVSESRQPCLTPTMVLNQSPIFAIKVDCTRGLVVEVLYDSDQVGVIVIKRNRRPKSFVAYSVKRLFKINKDLIEVLLMLEVLLTQYPKVEDLFCCTASCCEASVSFLGDCFCSRLYPVHNATAITGAIYQHNMYQDQPIAAYRRNLLSPLKKVHVSREVRVNEAVKKRKR